MKHRTHGIPLTLAALALAHVADAQPRPRIRAPRATMPATSTAPAQLRPAPTPAPSTMPTQFRALPATALMPAQVPPAATPAPAPAPAPVPAASPTPSPAPAPACAPLRTTSLAAGATQWRLEPAAGRPCAPPFALDATLPSHELQVVRVPARMAVSLSTSEGGLQLLSPGGAVVDAVDGLCSPGVRTGVAIVEPGTYVLRATGSSAAPRDVRVEAVAVPASARLASGEAHVPMSTALGDAPFDCERGDGVDVRVLACPRGSSLALTSPRGFYASVEGASSARTCYAVPSDGARTAPLPAGSLVVVRAWPYGAERGVAFVDVR